MTGRGNRGRTRAGAAMLAALSLALAVPAVSAADEGSPSGACDPIDPAVCLQPWPNDYFTVPDASTPTGRRLDLDPLSMPRNRVGKPIDPTDMNRADGFSPGNPIITRVPGLDGPEAFRRTGAVPITDMARYADRDQPIVVIDAATGKRHPVWSEIDSTATSAANVNLIVRPTVNFREGHRYIVALRRLRRADGSIIPAPSGFRVYRDRLATDQPAVEARRPHMESLFARLADSKIARRDLYLAWDFTVASRAVADRPDAGDSRRRLRRAQGRQPGRPEGGRRLTQVHGRQAHRLPRRQDRPRGRGHGHGALLPQPSRVPARRDVPARRRRQADPDPGQHDRRPLHLPHPALGAGTGPATPGPRSTAMACSAAAARSTRVSSRTWAATTT